MIKNLVLDLGNTRAKVAVFKGGELISVSFYDDEQLMDAVQLYRDHSVIISSVRNTSFTQEVAMRFEDVLILGPSTKLPIKNLYQTPKTLGNDRLANAVGAWSKFTKSNTLVIDAGTCIKYDFVTDQGEYLGGAISPGIEMRFKALHTFTDNLPLIDEVDSSELIGKTTNGSIINGVMVGIVSEIEGVISRYEEQFGQLNIVLTGGDAETVENLVKLEKNSIFADKFFTLKGLNEILMYNA